VSSGEGGPQSEVLQPLVSERAPCPELFANRTLLSPEVTATVKPFDQGVHSSLLLPFFKTG